MKTILTLSLMGALAAHAAPFGEQISETGIRHSFLLTGTRTIIVDEDSEVIWEVKAKSRDGWVLPNGNVLVAFRDAVKEFDREKKVVFQYQLSKENKEIGTVQRLENGNTLVTELGKKPRLLEVGQDGGIAVEVPLKPETDNAHMQTRMARKMANGNYLVPHLHAFAVKEYSPKGEVVRTIKTDLAELGGREKRNWPFTAILKEDGNVLVNLTNGNKTVVFDQDGKVVWKATNEDVAGRFADPCGGHLLDNGNFVVCAYGQKKNEMADLFEIDAEKKVVWEFKAPGFRGAHEVHILTTNGEKVVGKR
ncbi:MAG: beta-propeller domain-containing protein [Verrucomicrobiaceae bacterium]